MQRLSEVSSMPQALPDFRDHEIQRVVIARAMR
jgi:hypothetical protein